MPPGSDALAGAVPENSLPPLALARWPQIRSATRDLLLWPIGSTEQHGPHLPLGTDTVIADELARATHRRFPGVGLAPALPLGASGEHADFPGTLSIGTQALTSVVVEFVRHASLRWSHVLIVNGHGGNASALRSAEDLLRSEGRSLTVWHAAGAGHRADAHAGYRETSLMLFLRPETIRMDLAAAGALEPLSELIEQMRAGGVTAVSPNGVLGDPTGATAQRGQEFFDEMADRLIGLVRTLRRMDGPTPDR
ncbi:mycofactocin biosynthesis peptidyl-dipeptidase MftE [Nakamurella sp. PAMC28650]|uniref:mycofactocin biosynthesis peptidyl-dipeptidase MftE n=1 Tax=Nakamurella sp. PAMC28650 TaxID=2762325 RepID=UPI00210778FD|nr:mycofactocin biosynthesis peptidyl-dipeptidase MftE [Nakamurella sp. PAMC28650]